MHRKCDSFVGGRTTRSPAALFSKGEPCDYETTFVGSDGDNDAEW
jgi:hypothetical protein